MEVFDSPDYLQTIRKASGSSDDEVDMKHLVSLHAQSKSLSNHPIMLLPSACLSDVSQTNTITSPSSKYKRSKSRKKKSKKRQNGSKRHRRKQYDRRFTDTELYGGPFPFFCETKSNVFSFSCATKASKTTGEGKHKYRNRYVGGKLHDKQLCIIHIENNTSRDQMHSFCSFLYVICSVIVLSCFIFFRSYYFFQY
eukprot:781468_1